MVVAVIAAAWLPGGAGARPDQGIAQILARAGIDPATVTVQDGPLNYAGPACPGAGWDCTDGSGPVAQVGALNQADCFGNDCVIVQSGPANVARCEQRVPADAELTCSITQETTSGSNVATAIQIVDSSVRAPTIAVEPVEQEQRASGEIEIDQDATAGGSNDATVEQRLQQVAEAVITVGPVSQIQEATGSVRLEQDTVDGDGDNGAGITQWIDQRAQAQLDVGEIAQSQSRDDDGHNLDLFVRQNSDAGDNDAQVEQAHVAIAGGFGVLGPIEQLQGATDQGLAGDIDQTDRGGHSNYDVAQKKWWDQSGTTLGTLTQIQDDLELCCLIGGAGRTPDTCTITQFAQLEADDGATQSVNQRAVANAKENCSFQQTSSINGAVDTDSGGGTAFDNERGCAAGSCEVEERPLSRLATAIRNESAEGSFGSGDADPSETGAAPGDVLEYRLTYRNPGTGSASGVEIHAEVPDRATFLDCTGGCNTEGDVSWNIGDAAAGSSTVVTFRVELDHEGWAIGTTPVPLTPEVLAAGEEPWASNTVRANVVYDPPPESDLALDVRNETAQAEQDPVFTRDTSAGSFDVIEWRITYANHGLGSATNVTVTDLLPSTGVFLDCVGGCEVQESEGGDQLVSWDLGAVPGGESRVVSFRYELGEVDPGQYSVNLAEADTSEEGPVSSNQSFVWFPGCSNGFYPADPTTIDFEDLADGTFLTTQYAGLGVTFLDVPESSPEVISADGFGRTTHSGTNSVFGQNDTPSPGSAGTPMTMVFDPPVSRVGMYIGNAHVPLTATLAAYDQDGNEICSTTESEFGNDVQTLIGLDVFAPVIHSVTLDYGNTTLAEEIDDLMFEESAEGGPVP